MGIDTDIRRIARDAAREVFREELKQLELALGSQRAPREEPEPLLTVDEVARLCNVGPKTVQRWIARGLLRALRSPGMREYRVTRRDYEAFASGSTPSGEPRSPRPRDLDGEASRVLTAALSPRRARR
jgi:excisionase family DNA binding protein